MRFLFILSCVFSVLTAFGQELNCKVTILAPQLKKTEPRVFKTLETSLFEFMNSTKFTDLNMKPHERIQCQFILTITEEVGIDRFRATLMVVSSRPVFNSDYQSVLFNRQDENIDFQYAEYQPIEFNENAYLNNLSSIMAFYAYMILGYDFDSFGLEGGSPYFVKAQNIVNAAQISEGLGWQAFQNNRNRYWLVENVLNAKYKPLRKVYYDYHRNGIDNLYTNANQTRTTVFQTLSFVSAIATNYPSSVYLQVFMDAKADEFVQIFKGADPSTRIKAMNLLNKVDPNSSKKYEILKQL